MAGEADDFPRYLRLQVTKWKNTVQEIESVMDGCAKTDTKLADLVERCKGSAGHGRTDLESGQEALIRSRINRDGAASYGLLRKTDQERKMELLELRHELAKCTSELEAEGMTFDEATAMGETHLPRPVRRQRSAARLVEAGMAAATPRGASTASKLSTPKSSRSPKSPRSPQSRGHR
mmetsp:Transcript_33171/g.105030  ORF Transcript_33171/g.105030 Transcript_33171/m.105030 type:complete len:178 (-) Transcript_33171:145-678(-)